MKDSIIDTDRVDEIPRCRDVKIPIIFINITGASLSLILLSLCIIRMIYKKTHKSYLTKLIIIIFLSEIINAISKLLQLIKYFFEDFRRKFELNSMTARDYICEVQIGLALYSDFCSLLTTLLLSLRCYDVINNKCKYFSRKKNALKAMILVLIIPLIMASIFLVSDNFITGNNPSYRYRLRDRCSYWCWLAHNTSITCFVFYALILVFNMIYACKTINYLKRGYNKLLEENDLLPSKKRSINEEGNVKGSPTESTNKRNIILSAEEKKRIEEINIMKIKCYIYPIITIVIWLFAVIYRIPDDILMNKYDNVPQKSDAEREQELFEGNPAFQIFVQACLVLHTFVSAYRGIFYGFSFLVFEEKVFFNFFKTCCKCCFRNPLFDDLDQSAITDNTVENEFVKENSLDKENEEKNETDEKQEQFVDDGGNEFLDNNMNTSEYKNNEI